jgi:peptidoglycan/LPS O-acetylase OafA/YrhL
LWAGILLTVISVHWLGPQDRAVSLSTALANATLMHEYLGLKHVDGAYWSLVIEVTFYGWMALLYFTLKDWHKLRAALWLWLLVSYAGVMWWKQIPDGLEFLVKDLLFVKYAPLFIGGMLIHYSVEKPALRRFRAWRTRANNARAVTAPTTYI